MALTKKTTILLSPALHERLTSIGRQEGVSLGELVRRACEEQYGSASPRDRIDAVQTLSQLSLPVGDVATMEAESTASPDDLLP